MKRLLFELILIFVPLFFEAVALWLFLFAEGVWGRVLAAV